MEKSLLKQALSMGMDEGRTTRPGGEPPPWRARSRESSVPLEAWLTGSQTAELSEKPHSEDQLSPDFCPFLSSTPNKPVDELAVRACRMESACRVAIILSISSACCSRPTSSRASRAEETEVGVRDMKRHSREGRGCVCSPCDTETDRPCDPGFSAATGGLDTGIPTPPIYGLYPYVP